MQGGTTGILVTQSSGLPGGDGATIKIRGVASLLGSDPLVLVDGFEFDMDKLDPSTVESVSILKDAAAASIYGAKAGNGVILITTKRGSAGKVSVSYNGYFGIQQPIYLPDFVDGATYMEYINGQVYPRTDSDHARGERPDPLSQHRLDEGDDARDGPDPRAQLHRVGR